MEHSGDSSNEKMPRVEVTPLSNRNDVELVASAIRNAFGVEIGTRTCSTHNDSQMVHALTEFKRTRNVPNSMYEEFETAGEHDSIGLLLTFGSGCRRRTERFSIMSPSQHVKKMRRIYRSRGSVP
jgi:hypothetical protein